MKHIILALIGSFSMQAQNVPMLVVGKDAHTGIIYYSEDQQVTQELLGAKMPYGGHDPVDIKRLQEKYPGKIKSISFGLELKNGEPHIIQR